MKETLMTSALICLLATSGFAKDKTTKKDAAMDPKMQEKMQKWQQYSTPSEGHKVLEKMVGKWKYTSKMWEKPGTEPEQSTGESKLKLIMGGRFLQHDVKGKSMGQPFTGMGLTAFNNLTKKYETVWLDSMGTGMMHGTGEFNSESSTLSDSGKFSCPMHEDKERAFRSDWKIVDKDTMTFTMFTEDDNDDEFKMMEMTFKRTKEVSQN